MRRHLARLSFAVVLLTGAAAAPAQGAIEWAPCPDPGYGAFECARLSVPLDRSGAVGGTVDLFARRLRAPSNPTGTALVALAGGPGQAAAPLAPGFAVALAPALNDRDLLVFDQRGTGQSGPLSCRSLRGSTTSTRGVASCAEELGPRRGLYRTEDSVQDLEDLRRESGYANLALFGVSYGTKVAADYASRFGDRVERMALDSVVPQQGPDPLARSSFAAARRILRATAGTTAAVRKLVRRRRNARGFFVDGRGRKRSAEVSGGAIFPMLRNSDLNPAWRALLPGAIRAAARGDVTPLLRMAHLTLDRPSGSQVADQGTNNALNLATVCEEVRFPWDRGADAEQRGRQATRALLDTPGSAFAPFDRRTAATASVLGLCLGWPNASGAPADPAPLPGVPTLLLSGAVDVRTPVADAQAFSARLPGPTSLVVVPHVGHSVLTSDPSGCARASIASFFRDGAAAACPATRPLVSPLPRPARRQSELRAFRGYRGRVGRTLTAVLRTRDDALVSALGAQLDGRGAVGGLRRGIIRVGSGGVTLRNVEWVPGVRVTGAFLDGAGTARLSVRGSGARGTLVLRRGGGVTGRLGGRRISVASASAAPARGSDWTGFAPLRELAPLRRAAG